MRYSVGYLVPFLFLWSFDCLSQQREHITWDFSAIHVSGNEWKVIGTAIIDSGWHLYSQSIGADGPMPTSFSVDKQGVRLNGKVKELGVAKKSYDSIFMMNVTWYERRVDFEQLVKATSGAEVLGEVIYSVCSEEECVPGSVHFRVKLLK